MIGVLADSSERPVVSEFFELFKTPWEFYQEGQDYDVLLCAGDAGFKKYGKLILIYASRKLPWTATKRFDFFQAKRSVLSYKGAHPDLRGQHYAPGTG